MILSTQGIMSHITRLSDCNTLAEFSIFSHAVQVDRSSGARSFIYIVPSESKLELEITSENETEVKEIEQTTRSYSMNQIIRKFKACIEHSECNRELVDSILGRITNLNDAANEHVLENGCMYGLRKFFGNFFYALTHFGLGKNEILKQIASGDIKGIGYDNLANTNALITALSGGGDPSEVQELLNSGLNVNQYNYEGKNTLEEMLDLAKQGNLKPLKTILSLIDINQDAWGLYSNQYKINLKEDVKAVLVQALSTKDFIYFIEFFEFDKELQKDFFNSYYKYVCCNEYYSFDPAVCYSKKTIFDWGFEFKLPQEALDRFIHVDQ